jgi:hypothetical protein
MQPRDYKRDAIRVLFVLNAGKTHNTNTDSASLYPSFFRGEKRLQAMDFWVRYPDYLALELVAQYETSGDVLKLDRVKAIYADGEPSLRTIPMLRKHFGAYEPLDTALSLLECRGLVRPERRKTAVGHSHFFFLPKLAAEFCETICQTFPLLNWYRERAQLVAEVADGRSGKVLKDVQHAQREYHDTAILDYIPTITDRVKAKLHALGQ